MTPSIHPGTLLQRLYLVQLGISQNRLARELGVPPRRINEIVVCKRAITADTAVRLARYFGNEAMDWMRMQAEYDIARATGNPGPQIHDNRLPSSNEPENRLLSTTRVAGRNKNIRRRILR